MLINGIFSLFVPEFCLQVTEVAGCTPMEKQTRAILADENSASARRERLLERARQRKLARHLPIGQHDVDLIVE